MHSGAAGQIIHHCHDLRIETGVSCLLRLQNKLCCVEHQHTVETAASQCQSVTQAQHGHFDPTCVAQVLIDWYDWPSLIWYGGLISEAAAGLPVGPHTGRWLLMKTSSSGSFAPNIILRHVALLKKKKKPSDNDWKWDFFFIRSHESLKTVNNWSELIRAEDQDEAAAHSLVWCSHVWYWKPTELWIRCCAVC